MFALLFVSLVLATDPPSAPTPAPAPAATTTASVQKKADPTICRTYDEMGTRIAQKRVCKKASQWVMDDAEARGEHINQLNRMRDPGQPTG